MLLPLAGNIGSRHYGLTEAKEARVISTPAIKTSLAVQTMVKMIGLRDDIVSETVTTNFATEAIYSVPNVSTAQITILEMPTTSSEYSRQPQAVKQSLTLQTNTILPTTPHIHSHASHVGPSITVLSGPSRINFSIQPSRVVSFYRNLTNIFQSNSTAAPHDSENSANDGCTTGKNDENLCDTYVTRWVDFYLNVSIDITYVKRNLTSIFY